MQLHKGTKVPVIRGLRFTSFLGFIFLDTRPNEGIHLEKGARSSTSTMYQTLRPGSHLAPKALASSFSAYGQFRLILIALQLISRFRKLGQGNAYPAEARRQNFQPIPSSRFPVGQPLAILAGLPSFPQIAGFAGTRQPRWLVSRTCTDWAIKAYMPPLRLHLLCALAPDQNVVGSVDCGLHLAASYASLMPTQNPIDFWNMVAATKQKAHWGTSFRLGCRIRACTDRTSQL